MNKETRIALDKSINHWRYNLRCAKEGKSFNLRGDACALCQKFAAKIICKGCPVSAYTGYGECMNTPWHHVLDMTHYGTDEEIVDAVRDELGFLISLRPDKGP